MNKAELRKLYLEQRIALSDQDCVRFSEQIRDQLFHAIDFSSIHVLHTFLTIQRNKEPNTWLIIDRVKKEFTKVRLSIPKVNSTSTALESYFLDGTTQLAYNKWGISEPIQGVHTPASSIDLVLVPLLAFDANGYRVGYGKGFYDKYLAQCRPDCVKVGFCYFEPIDVIEGTRDFDVPLDLCITPNNAYVF